MCTTFFPQLIRYGSRSRNEASISLKRLQATIGVDFALKVLPWDEHTTIRLQVFELHVL
jgi:hypothetical protein